MRTKCGRCGQPMFPDWDQYGAYWHCVVCGRYHDPRELPDNAKLTPADWAGQTAEAITDQDGCDESPRCLDCPLERCRYDDWQWYQGVILHRQVAAINEAIDRTHCDMVQVAAELKMDVRTIYRRLERYREAGHSQVKGAK